MAYEDFARWYDALNAAADYETLAGKLVRILQMHHIEDGIVADLGCGTGEICLRLAEAGYDMIGVDASPEMLSAAREKLDKNPPEREVLLLCQRLEALDLYGTIRAAVSTFDTFSHIEKPALAKTLARVSLFLEPGGILVFDTNTVYKHEHILANNQFIVEGEDGIECEWNNCYNAENRSVHITLKGFAGNHEVFSECFNEYAYTGAELEALLAGAGLRMLAIVDGESFGPPHSETQRLLVTAQKTKI